MNQRPIHSGQRVKSSSLLIVSYNSSFFFQIGYPHRIINCHVNDVLDRNRNKRDDPVPMVPKKDVIILLPYLGLQSNQISKRLKSCIYQFYSCVKNVIFQNTCRIKSFFPYKDRRNR